MEIEEVTTDYWAGLLGYWTGGQLDCGAVGLGCWMDYWATGQRAAGLLGYLTGGLPEWRAAGLGAAGLLGYRAGGLLAAGLEDC